MQPFQKTHRGDFGACDCYRVILMTKHRWRLRLDLVCDLGPDGETETNFELTGEQETQSGDRPVNECIAIDMGNLCQMILSSNRVACASTFEDTSEAFADSSR
jgi:hypothetical protein